MYLGPHGTRGRKDAYDRVVAEWPANSPRHATSAAADYTITQLVGAFLRHADAYYRRPDGTPTAETTLFKSAVRPLVALYGPTPVARFGPVALAAVRARMAADGWCRTFINAECRRIRSVFKRGTSKELVPPMVSHALSSLAGLRKGRTPGVRESEPALPVEDAVVDARLPHLGPVVRAMVELQRLTGMRPGEVVALTPGQVEATGDVWTYRPAQHKTRHHGRERVVCIGPRAP